MIRFAPTHRACAAPPRPLLNIGCGSRRHPDWTNVDLLPAGPDVMACDIRRTLPFPAGCFRGIYAAHVLEHLEPLEARRMLAEIHRLLAPGGVVRIVVPDLEGIARAYLASLDRAAAEATPESRWEHRWMTVELLDQLVRVTPGGLMRRWWSCDPVPARAFIERRLGDEAAAGIAAVAAARGTGGEEPLAAAEIFQAATPTPRAVARYAARGERHRWMYDRVSLVDLLTEAGFRHVVPCDAVGSRISGFAAARLDADEQGRPRKPDSLYVEGVRP